MKIYDIAKCTSGNVLGIGVDENISDILLNNELVLNCNLLNGNISGRKDKKTKKEKKLKTIKIKKIRKIFKHKKVDFILCNVEEIKKYLKTFISDSIYINKDMLYIYNVKDEDVEEIEKKYKRYNTKIEKIKDGKTTILKIDNKNANTNFFKDHLYIIVDTLIQLFNIIGDLLLN